MSELRLDTKGRITHGTHTGWYLLISCEQNVSVEGEAESFSYYIDLGPNIELTGGAKAGKFNMFSPDYPSLRLLLEQNGIIDGDAIYVEWLDTSR